MIHDLLGEWMGREFVDKGLLAREMPPCLLQYASQFSSCRLRLSRVRSSIALLCTRAQIADCKLRSREANARGKVRGSTDWLAGLFRIFASAPPFNGRVPAFDPRLLQPLFDLFIPSLSPPLSRHG